MINVPDKPIVYFDVDNTLVFSSHEKPQLVGVYTETIEIGGRKWLVHREHVELLRDFDARGHTVVVWSAGGSNWAKMVCEALKIEKYVDICITKPTWYVDDKKCQDFMDDARYVYVGSSK